MKKPKIFYFTKYTTEGPSSRYRSFQYFPYFENHFTLIVYSLFDKDLSKKGGISLSFKVLYLFLKRIFHIIKVIFSNGLIVIEYELFPYTPPFFELILVLFKKKFILDFDDAIFHNYDKNSNKLVKFFLSEKIPTISKNASAIITGSTYLTNYFLNYNKKVFQIPTSIKFQHYQCKFKIKHKTKNVTIGWLGSKSTSYNVLLLSNIFKSLSNKYPNLNFLFCGLDKNLYVNFREINSHFIEWTEENEFLFLNSIDVGIMPLENNFFNNGKCGFKLIQYMAMGKLTISTPLLSNVEINGDNNNLFAENLSQWEFAIDLIMSNNILFDKIGLSNRNRVEKFYSCESNYNKYLEIFYSIN